MKDNCIFLEADPMGGTKEHTQWGYYCRAKDSYNNDIVCEGCESYDDGEEEGEEMNEGNIWEYQHSMLQLTDEEEIEKPFEKLEAQLKKKKATGK